MARFTPEEATRVTRLLHESRSFQAGHPVYYPACGNDLYHIKHLTDFKHGLFRDIDRVAIGRLKNSLVNKNQNPHLQVSETRDTNGRLEEVKLENLGLDHDRESRRVTLQVGDTTEHLPNTKLSFIYFGPYAAGMPSKELLDRLIMENLGPGGLYYNLAEITRLEDPNKLRDLGLEEISNMSGLYRKIDVGQPSTPRTGGRWIKTPTGMVLREDIR
ncbi:MAG: hypothetical protein GOV15_04070 [Candidatus Diapherotrites archaeon]|nr:hypothetical protein [Candidatus Diapherotrites archaeon]